MTDEKSETAPNSSADSTLDAGTGNPTRKWSAEAHPNLALIKYMGKAEVATNRPTNSSLSYRLTGLKTVVEVELIRQGADTWEPLTGPNLLPIELSELGKNKFLSHAARVREYFQIAQPVVVRSANSFPSDSGLASSASSFAALTKAISAMATELKGVNPTPQELAALSRLGSGSSCRSFFGPWCGWLTTGLVGEVETPWPSLLHFVVTGGNAKKQISSTQAHAMVLTSLNFNGRPLRAEDRLRMVMCSFQDSNWLQFANIVWNEFWDMHSLFETSADPFGYMTKTSLEILDVVRTQWQIERDGPVVTMDAGASVHLLFRLDQLSMAEKMRSNLRHLGKTWSSW